MLDQLLAAASRASRFQPQSPSAQYTQAANSAFDSAKGYRDEAAGLLQRLYSAPPPDATTGLGIDPKIAGNALLAGFVGRLLGAENAMVEARKYVGGARQRALAESQVARQNDMARFQRDQERQLGMYQGLQAQAGDAVKRASELFDMAARELDQETRFRIAKLNQDGKLQAKQIDAAMRAMSEETKRGEDFFEYDGIKRAFMDSGASENDAALKAMLVVTHRSRLADSQIGANTARADLYQQQGKRVESQMALDDATAGMRSAQEQYWAGRATRPVTSPSRKPQGPTGPSAAAEYAPFVPDADIKRAVTGMEAAFKTLTGTDYDDMPNNVMNFVVLMTNAANGDAKAKRAVELFAAITKAREEMAGVGNQQPSLRGPIGG